MWYDSFMRKDYGIEKQRQVIHTVRRADIILIIGCLLLAVMIGVLLAMYRVEGGAVSVSCDGVETAVFTFEKSGSDTFETKYYLIQSMETAPVINVYETYPELPEGESYNLFSITDGVVRMEAADCSDQICVHHNAISAEKESIICLPHKVVITVTENSDIPSEPDNRDAKTGNEGFDGVVE